MFEEPTTLLKNKSEHFKAKWCNSQLWHKWQWFKPLMHWSSWIKTWWSSLSGKTLVNAGAFSPQLKGSRWIRRPRSTPFSRIWQWWFSNRFSFRRLPSEIPEIQFFDLSYWSNMGRGSLRAGACTRYRMGGTRNMPSYSVHQWVVGYILQNYTQIT